MPLNYDGNPRGNRNPRGRNTAVPSTNTALAPTGMPVPGSSDVISARQNTLRSLKKKKGRASTILTGLFGQGSPTAPVTALGGVDSLASDLFVDPIEDQLAGIFRPRARRNRYPSPRYRER